MLLCAHRFLGFFAFVFLQTVEPKAYSVQNIKTFTCGIVFAIKIMLQ